ncbi:MAG: winged helix-turn-helix transcriptional regulator [Thiothrix sp.]|nr:MAG: winged helix-turn-helix transcriptional regulator [Thiothrix sp.]
MSTTPENKSKLDRIDKKILRELQNDGRISFVDLAEKVGLSTSPCLERVRRLERAGYIKGYTALLCPAQMDASLLVFVEISLNYLSGDIFEQFRDAVRQWPQILECHLVAGDFDYLLKIRIKNMASYRTLLGDILHTLPGIRDSRTLVAMETVYESSQLYID